MHKLSIVIGIVLCTDAVVMGIMANYNAGVVLTLLIGLSMTLYGFCRKKYDDKAFIKIVDFTYYLGLASLTVLIAFISIYGNIDNVTYKEDAVIVLGAGLRGDKITAPLYYRLEAAIEYYNKNSDSFIVVSGGMGAGETTTEASAMKKYLISRGVPQDVIIAEDKATSTYENLIFSKALLREKLGDNFKTVVVTNAFHVYRADRLAKVCGIDATHLHGGINWYTIPVNYIRECAAVLKTWVFGY